MKVTTFFSLLWLFYLPIATGRELHEKAPFLPNDKIDVLRYEIDLTFPALAESDLPAHVAITFRAFSKLDTLELHASKAHEAINRVEREGTAQSFKFIVGQDGGDILAVNFAHPVASGETVRVILDYTLKYQGAGESFRLTDYLQTKIWNLTNWPTNARNWLPSNDSPADPATFQFTLHVPAGMIAAANGNLTRGTIETGSGTDAQGRRVYVWEQAVPIPTYDINVVVGDFKVHEAPVCYDDSYVGDKWEPCDHAERKSIFLYLDPAHGDFPTALLDRARAAIYFSSVLGSYPYAKLGWVDAPQQYIMESASLITGVEATAHELAHQWWGNSVGIKSWGDIWISEGFATYFSDLYAEYRDGTAPSYSAKPDDCPLNLAEDTGPRLTCVYAKGAAALHDLRRQIGRLTGSDQSARQIFLTLFHKVHDKFLLKRLGTAELVDYLAAHLGEACRENGVSVNDSTGQRLIGQWEKKWTVHYSIQP